MTDLKPRSGDTGETCRDLGPSADRATGGVHRVDGPTRPMSPGAPTAPMNPLVATAPISPLPRRQTDEHAAITVPETIAVVPDLVATDTRLPRPALPPPPPAPRGDWAVPVGEWPIVRHRAARPSFRLSLYGALSGVIVIAWALTMLVVMW